MVAKIDDSKKLILNRLLDGLKEAGVEFGSRNKTVAKTTGYNEKTVANILSGNSTLTARFVRTVCADFGINQHYVETGIAKDSKSNPPARFWTKTDLQAGGDGTPIQRIAANISEAIPGLSDGINLPEVREGIKELLKMPEARRWEAVGVLKRMNEKDGDK